MVTHMVFTSPVLFFDFGGAVVWGELFEVVLGSALAAGPLVLFVLGLLLFFSFFFFRDEEESELVAAVVPAVAGPDGVAPPPPPPPSAVPLEVRDEEVAAVADDEDDDEDDEDDEDVARVRSRVHSSLCPARHAARWQAWLQYFRCRQPEQKCRAWSFEARVWQNAHSSMVAGLSRRGRPRSRRRV